MGWESQQFFHSSMFIAWVFGNVSFVLPVNCFSLSGWAVGFCCMPSLSHPDQLQIHADIQKFIRRLLNANEVHIHPLISQVWILLNGGLRFWTKKLVHVPARPDFITDDCWTYSNSVVRNQHWWSALQLVSDRSISPFRTRAGTFLKLVWKWSFWWSQTCVNWLALLYHILFNANSCLDNIQWYLHDALLQMLDLLVRHTHTHTHTCVVLMQFIARKETEGSPQGASGILLWRGINLLQPGVSI